MRYNSLGYLILVRHGAPCFKPDDKLASWTFLSAGKELKKLLIAQLNSKISN